MINKIRTFYLDSQECEYELTQEEQERLERWPNQDYGKYWSCRAFENGKEWGNWTNGQIRYRYQANIFAAMKVIFQLKEEKWQGEVNIYLPDEVPVEEAPNFKEAIKVRVDSEEGRKEIHYDLARFKKEGKKRWLYNATAHYQAQLNGIDLTLKKMPIKEIRAANQLIGHFFNLYTQPRAKEGKAKS